MNLKYNKIISILYLQACNSIRMFTPSVHCVCHLILPFFSALNWPLWLLPRIKDTKYLCTCNKYACHACLSTLHFFRINQLSLKFIEFCYGIPFKLTAAVEIKVNTLKQENNPTSTVWSGPIWIKFMYWRSEKRDFKFDHVLLYNIFVHTVLYGWYHNN